VALGPNSKVVRLVEREPGFTCTPNGGHWKIRFEGRVVGMLGGSPGDRRAMRNVARDLKAAGHPGLAEKVKRL
jgi:hypothetical protein